MPLWPAATWMSFVDAPAIANHEQNVWRLQCHRYPVIFASSKHGLNQERVEKVAPSRGKTRSPAFRPGRFKDSIAAIASAFKSTVRSDPFLVFVSSMARRSRCTIELTKTKNGSD